MMRLLKPAIPAINYRHPANNNVQFSFVASPGFSAFDLVKRQFGTLTGAPTKTNDAIIGEAIKFRSGQSDVYSFPNRSTLGVPATMAVIGILNSVAGSSRTYFQNSSNAAGLVFDNQSSGTIQLIARNVIVYNPAIAVSAGVPYLLVGSLAANVTVNMMTVRLDTGAIVTATSTNAGVPAAGNGTFILGNLDLAVQSADADLAAVLFSNTFLTLNELMAWAVDPWGPWQLKQFDVNLLMASTGYNFISGNKTMGDFSSSQTLNNVPFGALDHWSTTFNSGSFSLSNGNMTATATAHNTVDTIIGVVGHNEGKYYFEHSSPTGSDCYSGLASVTQSTGQAISATGVALHYDGAGAAGTWISNGSTSLASGLTVNLGKVLGFAVDFGAGRIYVRDTAVPGSWFGAGAGADPVAGTGGYDWHINNNATMFQGFTSFQNGINEASTMNAGAGAFIADPPAGYRAWNAVSGGGSSGETAVSVIS